MAATRQVRKTKSVILPGYSFPPLVLTIAPPAIVETGSDQAQRTFTELITQRRGGRNQERIDDILFLPVLCELRKRQMILLIEIGLGEDNTNLGNVIIRHAKYILI